MPLIMSSSESPGCASASCHPQLQGARLAQKVLTSVLPCGVEAQWGLHLLAWGHPPYSCAPPPMAFTAENTSMRPVLGGQQEKVMPRLSTECPEPPQISSKGGAQRTGSQEQRSWPWPVPTWPNFLISPVTPEEQKALWHHLTVSNNTQGICSCFWAPLATRRGSWGTARSRPAGCRRGDATTESRRDRRPLAAAAVGGTPGGRRGVPPPPALRNGGQQATGGAPPPLLARGTAERALPGGGPAARPPFGGKAPFSWRVAPACPRPGGSPIGSHLSFSAAPQIPERGQAAGGGGLPLSPRLSR